MVLINSFTPAVIMCIITMICWGSHANTLKMKSKSYAFPFYYWDQAIGYLLLPLIFALTLGSMGSVGRGFINDLLQGDFNSFSMAILAGFVFNLANILFVSAVDIAGMSVAFPIGIGIALVEGVVINYIAKPTGNPVLVFIGVALITAAIIVNAMAYKRMKSEEENTDIKKGITLALVGGILMGLFYYLLQVSIASDFNAPEAGKFGPYAAVVVFAFSSLISNFIFNSYIMARPFKGEPAKYADYVAKGTGKQHAIGILGGLINGMGTTFNIIASGVVGGAIAYGLGQGAPMIAAIWGVFVWKEFKNAPKGTNVLIAAMFVLFIIGLSLLVISKL
jgi:glucose uptake protein